MNDDALSCNSVPPRFRPGVLGIPGWIIPEGDDFVPGKFRFSFQTVAATATAWEIAGVSGGWTTDINLTTFMPNSAEFLLLCTGFRLAVQTLAPSATDAAVFGDIAGGAYLQHTPTGKGARKFAMLGHTYRMGDTIQATAADTTVGGALHMDWYHLPMARPVRIRDDSFSLIIPAQDALAPIVTVEVQGAAIATRQIDSIPTGVAARTAILDRIARRYPKMAPSLFATWIRNLRG